MIQYISALTGAITILVSLWLLSQRRITLEHGGDGGQAKQPAMTADIFKLFKFSSSDSAIGLFMIGVILIMVPMLKSPEHTEMYKVAGSVQANDHGRLHEVEIVTDFPPLHLTDKGEIEGVWVSKRNGKFPTLSLSHPNYSLEAIDLNDGDKVRVVDGYVKLKQPITLLSMGGGK